VLFSRIPPKLHVQRYT